MTRASAALAVLLAACGARTGVDVASASDAGASFARDASRPDAGARDAGIDAGELPFRCPPSSGIGFTIAPLGPRTLDEGMRALSLASDGPRVWLAVETVTTRVQVWRVDVEPPERLFDAPGTAPALAFGDGGLALAWLDGEAIGFATGDDLAPRRLRVLRGPPNTVGRPIHNGRDWLLGYTNGFEAYFGPVRGDGVDGWIAFGPGGPVVRAAVDPASGRAWVVLRTGDTRLRLYGFDRDGGEVGPPEGVRLEDHAWDGVPSLGFSDDGFEQPIVLGGFTVDDDGPRIRARRFRLDGAGGSGYSGPTPGGPFVFDLSTAPPADHRSGYGLFGGGLIGGAWSMWFHGSGDFVGDTQDLFTAGGLDGFSVSIAGHPCGYVLAHGDAAGPTVQMLLAIPRPPRGG